LPGTGQLSAWHHVGVSRLLVCALALGVLPMASACGGGDELGEVDSSFDCSSSFDADEYAMIATVIGLDSPIVMLEDPAGRQCVVHLGSRVGHSSVVTRVGVPTILNDPSNGLRLRGGDAVEVTRDDGQTVFVLPADEASEDFGTEEGPPSPGGIDREDPVPVRKVRRP
jgi:hypothetical protein